MWCVYYNILLDLCPCLCVSRLVFTFLPLWSLGNKFQMKFHIPGASWLRWACSLPLIALAMEALRKIMFFFFFFLRLEFSIHEFSGLRRFYNTKLAASLGVKILGPKTDSMPISHKGCGFNTISWVLWCVMSLQSLVTFLVLFKIVCMFNMGNSASTRTTHDETFYNDNNIADVSIACIKAHLKSGRPAKEFRVWLGTEIWNFKLYFMNIRSYEHIYYTHIFFSSHNCILH